jgi:rhodanese-related sulfurtransferase
MRKPVFERIFDSMNTTMTAPELHRRLAAGERFQLIDVRSPREYAEGHVPGAMNLPMDEAEARVDDMRPHDPVVLVCQSGKRASMTCDLLKPHRGDLVVLEGGTSAWMSSGFDVVRSVRTRLPLMRQVQLIAGLMVVAGATLALTVAIAWIGLALFVGLGLTLAGATGFCGMAILLEKMPWNRPAKGVAPTAGPACAK